MSKRKKEAEKSIKLGKKRQLQTKIRGTENSDGFPRNLNIKKKENQPGDKSRKKCKLREGKRLI